MTRVDLDTIGPDGWASPDTVLFMVDELRAAREVVRQTRGYLAMFNGTPELRQAVSAYDQVVTS